MKSVYVVILNFNHLNDLIETIDSFKKQSFAKYELVVVDNNSTDESVKYIQQYYPSIHLIQNKKNLGWSGGNNTGINYAMDQGADYVLLANNDLYFEDAEIITELVNGLEKYPEIGIIGPQENEYSEKNKCSNQGWIMYPKAKYKFNNLRREASVFPSDYIVVDNVSGSFMLIRTELFRKLGLIDNELFLYAEDTDFSLRAWKAGFSSVINTSCIIHHKGSATSGINSPLKIYYKSRNLIYLIKKHKDIQENYAFFYLKYYYDCFKMIFKILFLKEYSHKRWRLLAAHLSGALHGGLMRKMGKVY